MQAVDASGQRSGEGPAGVAGVEEAIRSHVLGRGLPAALAEAVLYAGLGPGKRVRPRLVLLAFGAVAGGEAAAGAERAAVRAAAAVEMVHAFSLVHDDLPAMDDDDLRRGRPTLHRHSSEAMAILGGDALLSMAFEVVAGVDDAPLAAALTGELATATTDMIAGQVYDTLPGIADSADGLTSAATVEAAGVDPSAVSGLMRTHRLKTGALLRAAARMGGRCGGADAAQLDALTRYADAVGLMFQVIDDLLDVTSDAATLGKATQKDGAAGKRTYPGLLGLDGARAEATRLRGEALGALTPFGPAAVPLRELAEALAERDR